MGIQFGGVRGISTAERAIVGDPNMVAMDAVTTLLSSHMHAGAEMPIYRLCTPDQVWSNSHLSITTP